MAKDTSGTVGRSPLGKAPLSSKGGLALAVTLSLALIALIGYLDVITGQLAMSLFYLIPIVVIAWWHGNVAASGIAAWAAAVWLWSDVAVGAYEAHISYWNGFTRLIIFGAMGWFVGLLRTDRIQMGRLNYQLSEALARESGLARRDQLTGLPNSRAFEEILSREIARSLREETPLGLGYIDLDNFKRVNDTKGHTEGDELLQRVGQALFLSIREEDYAARLGGDEFALILLRPDERTYEAVASRIYERIGELAAGYPGLGFGATIGFVHFARAPRDSVTAVRVADEAMYAVKEHHKGQHQVMQAEG